MELKIDILPPKCAIEVELGTTVEEQLTAAAKWAANRT